MIASILGGILGSLIQLLLEPRNLPVLGFVIGGLVFFGLSEAMRATDH